MQDRTVEDNIAVLLGFDQPTLRARMQERSHVEQNQRTKDAKMFRAR